LAASEPTGFDPDRDVAALVRRGEAQIEEATRIINESERAIAALLQSLIDARAAELSSGSVEVAALELEAALATYLPEVIEAVEAAGYERLIRDTLFLNRAGSVEPAPPEALAIFQAQIDQSLMGTLTFDAPPNLELKSVTRGDEAPIFRTLKGDLPNSAATALLVLELIAPVGQGAGLLDISAIDLATQEPIARRLAGIDELAPFGLPTASRSERLLPMRASFREDQPVIRRFAALETAYVFELQGGDDLPVATAYLQKILEENTEIDLVASPQIKRLYGDSLGKPDAWLGMANATFMLERDAENGDGAAIQVKAQPKGSDRIIELGTLELFAD
jgi:hypothetical protein